jgi:antitoxin component YwqK of YwqJK toxin-antitoxin module
MVSRMALLVLVFGVFGCAVSKPCRDAGDVMLAEDEGNGNTRCHQKDFDGKPYNHGEYKHYFLDGSPAVEGQFVAGKKDGIWILYNQRHDVKAVKYFDQGVERSAPPETQKLIDEIIRKKSEFPNMNDKSKRGSI